MTKRTGEFKNKVYVGYWLPKNLAQKIHKEIKEKSIFAQACIEEYTGWTQKFLNKRKNKQ